MQEKTRRITGNGAGSQGRGDRSRAVLWIGLGLLWLVDGLLQIQPAMFTHQFVEQVLQPAAEGQPQWFAALLQLGAALWLQHPVLSNLGAVVIQLGIGGMLIAGRERRWGRIGLWLSIAWGLNIWVLGEGLGGLLVGSSTGITGAPGSVLVYVVGAILLLLPTTPWAPGSAGRVAARVLGVFWVAMAVLQALPSAGYWTGEQLGALFATVAGMPQPAALAAPIQGMAAVALAAPVVCNACFVAIMACLGWAFLAGKVARWTFALAGAWLLFPWWLGQDFGGLFTGTSTDPNTALPLGVLLLAAVLGYGQAGVKPLRYTEATPGIEQGRPQVRTIRLRSAQELRAAAAINRRPAIES
jgi:hypothetical protein